VSDVRQTEIHKAEPLVPELNAFEVEMAIEKLKTQKSSGTDQIPAGGRTICSEIHKCINSIWNKEELPEDWKESIIVPIYENGSEINCNYRGISVLLIHTQFYPTSCCEG